MGYGSYSKSATDHLYSSRVGASVDSVFHSNVTRKVAPAMAPEALVVRECRDSMEHPNSVGIMIFLDETGSMGQIPIQLVKGNLKDKPKMATLLETIIKHGTPDAAVNFSFIGDHLYDSSPLQVGQFESDTLKIDAQLTSGFLEGAGGGQNMESYLLAWLVAAKHTVLDSFEKRGQKGILFTIGDEKTHPVLTNRDMLNLGIAGYGQCENMTAEDLLAEAQKMYEVFHLHCNTTQYRNNVSVLDHWRKLLGERLIIVNDIDQIPEIIASTVALLSGAKLDDVVKDFDPKIAREVMVSLATVDTNRTSVAASTPGVKTL